MESGDQRRFYDGQAFSRLWEKSAIGILTEGPGILLSDSEIIFCREHRGVSFDDISNQETFANWLSERIRTNPNILLESTVLESLRVPGNKVVLAENFEKLGLEDSGSWAMRWDSDKHPSRDDPDSEILWFESKDPIHDELLNPKSGFEYLLQWSVEVTKKGRLPEVLIIDEEQSVVTYRLSEAEPNGEMSQPTNQELGLISERTSESLGRNGIFINDGSNWPTEAIGIPLLGGRQLDTTEAEIIHSHNKDENTGFISVSGSIQIDLWKRGLNTRSGFKYGTSWRCYSGEISEGHAPWLVVDPSREGPANWADACLSSRLASGVNKHWIYPVYDSGKWRYLQISRPPSDSRWSNPKRI